METRQPKLIPVPAKNQYRLIDDYEFTAGCQTFTIEDGFIFDGASVPWVGWIPTYTPFHPDVMAAAIAHDWLYTNQHLSRKEADRLFYDRLINNGASKTKARMMYVAVRMAGAVYFHKRRVA